METITTALGTAISTLTEQITSSIGANLPAILGVGAIFIVIPAVWRLVKKFAK